MALPRITIVTPSFYQGRYVEYIAMDGGSTLKAFDMPKAVAEPMAKSVVIIIGEFDLKGLARKWLA
jgi:hypothetical protein